MPNTLFLRLEGPLQSWGERGRWSVRDSAPEPTKSGVVGLLACALGLGEDDDVRALSQQLRVGVRCDRPGTPLVDYHTVVGGVMSAEGKIKRTASTGEPETVVSWRQYLCDASFLVAVHANETLIGRLSAAVQSPKWPVFLGRKSCLPSCPVYEGVGDYPSLAAALADPPLAERAASKTVRTVVESSPAQGIRRRDEVLSRRYRTFGPRHVQESHVTIGEKEVQPCTSPD